MYLFLEVFVCVMASSETKHISCGGAALYILFQLHDHNTAPNEIMASLDWRESSSLNDLLAASNDFGFPLQASQIQRNEPFPQMPFIAHVRRNRHDDGHFVVIRPLPNGQFQLLNPPDSPRLVDYQALRDWELFDGWVAYPKDRFTNHVLSLARIAGVICMMLGIGYALRVLLSKFPEATENCNLIS